MSRRRPTCRLSSDPAGWSPRLSGLLAEVREGRLGLVHVGPSLLQVLARAIPRRLDDVVAVVAVAPCVEIVLEALGLGLQLLDARTRLRRARPQVRRALAPLLFGAAVVVL